jgi:hypothetical protein
MNKQNRNFTPNTKRTQNEHRPVTIQLAIIEFVVLQNRADLEEVRGRYSEMCRDEAVSIKCEVFSDAEEGEYPVPRTFPKIKAEPEVSCGSARWIS